MDYVEPIKAIFREKRFIVREFSYDAANSGGLDVQIEQSKLEFKQMRNTIIRWCKAHFGEAYNGWVHLKVIRAFVESVLRYGLPVDFTAFFIEPNMKMEKEVLKALTKSVLQCRPALQPKSSLEDEDDEGDFDTLPYVCQCFPLIGANS